MAISKPNLHIKVTPAPATVEGKPQHIFWLLTSFIIRSAFETKQDAGLGVSMI